MRRTPLAALVLAAACSSGAPAPSSAPAPAARPAAPAGDPTSLRYSAGTARYRYASSTSTAQEVMGNSQEFAITQDLVLSTAIAASGSELALSVTVDSAQATSTVPGADPNTELARMRGQTVRTAIHPNGRPVGASSDTGIAGQLSRSFREFLAPLPAGTLAAGMTWSDTAETSNPLPGGAGQISARAVRNHRVVGWETKDGVRALHLITNGQVALTGNGETQGQPIEMTGTGTVEAHRWVSAAGAYLGGTVADSTNLNVNVVSMGMQIPVRQVQRTTITRLP